MAKEFLIELGTEELPPTQLRTLAEAFAANFEAELKGREPGSRRCEMVRSTSSSCS
ncbi:glycyl-tRNA synthetase beta chain [Vibrio astriarenae]|nr:glycyl-tRNA synthetase beta chain [Vibrio sp. C7]